MVTQAYRNDITIEANHDMGVDPGSGDQRKVHALFDTSIVGPQDIGRTHFATAPQLSTSWELWRSSSSIEVTHELQSQARFFPRWPGNDLAILPSQDDRPNNFDDLLEQGVQ